MPLNNDGVPCMRIKKWVKAVDESGKIVRDSGGAIVQYTVPELVPAKDLGWTEELIIEIPLYNNKRGLFESHKYRFRTSSYRCAACKTSQHVMLKLASVPWTQECPIKGTGIFFRCFKHDVTTGPADPDDYAEELEVKTVSRDEALKICEKYGLQPQF